ncbi:aminopeptidase N [Siculibacillus lacustris]|uniref:Aminopeptidase N n=1 Tax=Siculibacillus lacustris TaxID=1549641 RepID=A0A4Q9VX52_9HYPH|nr:aminopeptidase N [Siculibacillus lacustris]TBW40958.1 aminopeptidase N [Siculibacillus lacustris]
MDLGSEGRTSETIRLADYRPTPYAITEVRLDFRLDLDGTRVVAETLFRRRDGIAAGTPLVLDGDELDLAEIRLDGAPLPPDAWTATPQRLEVRTPPADDFHLTVTTWLDPERNTKLMGLYRTSGNWCTQCEAEGFRRITYFLDRPDVLAVYTTRIEAPRAAAPYLLSNGNRIDAGDVPGTDRHFAVWHDPFPKPAYLFAMVAGTFERIADRFVTASGREVALEIYVEPGRGARTAHAMDSLKRSMRWDETEYGREYDLDVFMIVAVDDFNMGAMENKGLNVFNEKYVLADSETATDADYAHVEGVIAHEYFHNWTGNRITCRDWFQLCLKEGLTVFRDQDFSGDQRSRPVKRIADVRLLKSHQFPEDAGPLAHPVRPSTYREINNFYTATVYEKGAEVVRMLKTLIGADGFRAGMDLYFARHDGSAATIEDFLACFADATGRDLERFKLWYTQSGTPDVMVSTHWDASAGRLRLTFDQTALPTPGQPVKAPMVVPIRFGLVGPSGDDLAWERVSGAEVAGDVIVLDGAHHEVVFEGVTARPVPSLLRGFSAPVRLTLGSDTADLLHLMSHDRDPFNRWQAGQALAMRALISGTQAARTGQTVEIDPALASAFAAVAADESLDTAFRALAITLPNDADVAREIGTDVDPDAIATAIEQLRARVATAGRATFRRIHAEMASSGPYRADAEAAGRRALRNAVLDHLVRAGDGDLAAQRYRQADNMTDRLAALTAAVTVGLPSAEDLLADFYQRFAGDPLVIDKWLMVQATAPRAETLDRVRALTAHPAFAATNPNRVRALITTFATGNQTQFNRADGAGFAFVADQVLMLDRINPQVAARLLSAFRSWRALEPRRRAYAEAELKRIVAAPDLSRDVADIAGRSLE